VIELRSKITEGESDTPFKMQYKLRLKNNSRLTVEIYTETTAIITDKIYFLSLLVNILVVLGLILTFNASFQPMRLHYITLHYIEII